MTRVVEQQELVLPDRPSGYLAEVTEQNVLPAGSTDGKRVDEDLQGGRDER
ncbi:MAG: hypothetical protein ABSF26_02555 [Thermoguttaceae bacterium]